MSSASSMSSRVVVVQREVPPYRVPLFEGVRDRLADSGIDFELVAGDCERQDGGQNVPPAWATIVPVRTHRRLPVEYMPVIRSSASADLVILEQAAKFVHTPILIGRQRLGGPPIALWGHGLNLQLSRRNEIGERLKAAMTSAAHWFFAYTPGTATLVESLGFDARRITTLHNTIDVGPLVDAVDRAADYTPRQRHRALFIGRLYDLKRPLFLIEAARRVREILPNFQLTIIGEGPLEAEVKRASEELDWLDYLGGIKGDEGIAPHLASASLMLLPGMVGLASVDAIVSGLPGVVIADQEHAPEFEYFTHGETALVLDRDASPAQFGEAVANLLNDDAELERMRNACFGLRDQFSMENMVTEFSDGVLAALEAG